MKNWWKSWGKPGPNPEEIPYIGPTIPIPAPEPIRGELRLVGDGAYDTTLAGSPLVEMATEMTVGPCVRCGRGPDDYEGGMLENVRVEDGVLTGDNVCEDCARIDDPDFNLDEVLPT